MGKKSTKRKTTWRAFSLDGEGRKRPPQQQRHANGAPSTQATSGGGAGAVTNGTTKSEVSSWRRQVIAESTSESTANTTSSATTTTPPHGNNHHHHQQQQYYDGYDYHQQHAGRRPWRSPGPGAPFRGGRRSSGGPRGYHNQSNHFHTASPYHQRFRYDASRINSLEGDVPDAFPEGYVFTSADQLPSFLQATSSVDGEISANEESYWTEEQQAAAGYFNPYNVYPCFTSPNSPPMLLSPPYHPLMWYEDPRLPPDCQYYFCLTQPFPPPPSYSPPDGGGGGGSAGEEDGTGTVTSAEGSTVPTTPESEQQDVDVDSGDISTSGVVEVAPDSLSSPSTTPSVGGGVPQVVPPSPSYIYPGNFMFRPYIYPSTSGHGPYWHWTDNEGPRRFVRRHRRRPFIGGEGITFDRWPSRKNGPQTDDKCNRQNSSLSSSNSDLVSVPTTTATMNGTSPQQQHNQGQENAVSNVGGGGGAATNGQVRRDTPERTMATDGEADTTVPPTPPPPPKTTTIDTTTIDDAGATTSDIAIGDNVDSVIQRVTADSRPAPLALEDDVSKPNPSTKIQQQQPQPLPPPPPLQHQNLNRQQQQQSRGARDGEEVDDRQRAVAVKNEAKSSKGDAAKSSPRNEAKTPSPPKNNNERRKTPPQQRKNETSEQRKTPPRNAASTSPKEKRQTGGRGSKQNKAANRSNGPTTVDRSESQNEDREEPVASAVGDVSGEDGGGVVVKMASTIVPLEEAATVIKEEEVKQVAVEQVAVKEADEEAKVVESLPEKEVELASGPIDDNSIELPVDPVVIVDAHPVDEVAVQEEVPVPKEVPNGHPEVEEVPAPKIAAQPEVASAVPEVPPPNKSAANSKFILDGDADVFVPSPSPPARNLPPTRISPSSESGPATVVGNCNGVANGYGNHHSAPTPIANGTPAANATYRLESPVQYSKYYQLCSQYSMDDLDDAGRLTADEMPPMINTTTTVAGTRRSSSNSNGSAKLPAVLPPGNEIILHEAADSASECGSEDVEMIGHRYETAADRLYKNNTVSLAAELLQSSGGQLPYGSPASECRTNSHVLEGFYGARPAAGAAAGSQSSSKSNGQCVGQVDTGSKVAPCGGERRRRREAGDSGIHTDESADDEDGTNKMAFAAGTDEDEILFSRTPRETGAALPPRRLGRGVRGENAPLIYLRSKTPWGCCCVVM